MVFNWVVNNDFIFGFKNTDNIKSASDVNKIEKINLFDLDCTLIKTKSGRVFPKDKNDWEFLYDKVPEVLNDKKYLNCIISNQSGLKNKEKINDWKFKINNICKNLNITYVFASINHNKYRKPMCYSWYYIVHKIKENNIKIDKFIKQKKIYYIGDACGRKNDFSDTDLKYAKNCDLKFRTPELFFKPPNYKDSDKSATIKYPILKYYDKNKILKILNIIKNKIKNKNKILIMIIGFPASGKSFLRKFLINNLNDFKYFNNDDTKENKIKNNSDKNINDKLVLSPEKYDKIIDDNTNLNIKERKNTLTKYKNYYKIGITFNLSDEIINHLNYLRMYEFNGKIIPKVVYNKLKKSSNIESLSEEFDYLIKINKLFPEYKEKTSLKYYF